MPISRDVVAALFNHLRLFYKRGTKTSLKVYRPLIGTVPSPEVAARQGRREFGAGLSAAGIPSLKARYAPHSAWASGFEDYAVRLRHAQITFGDTLETSCVMATFLAENPSITRIWMICVTPYGGIPPTQHYFVLADDGSATGDPATWTGELVRTQTIYKPVVSHLKTSGGAIPVQQNETRTGAHAFFSRLSASQGGFWAFDYLFKTACAGREYAEAITQKAAGYDVQRKEIAPVRVGDAPAIGMQASHYARSIRLATDVVTVTPLSLAKLRAAVQDAGLPARMRIGIVLGDSTDLDVPQWVPPLFGATGALRASQDAPNASQIASLVRALGHEPVAISEYGLNLGMQVLSPPGPGLTRAVAKLCANQHWVVALSANIPTVDADLIERLVRAPSEHGVVAVMNTGTGIFLPLAARYKVSAVRPALENALFMVRATGSYPDWSGQIAVVPVPLSPEEQAAFFPT